MTKVNLKKLCENMYEFLTEVSNARRRIIKAMEACADPEEYAELDTEHYNLSLLLDSLEDAISYTNEYNEDYRRRA